MSDGMFMVSCNVPVGEVLIFWIKISQHHLIKADLG